MEHSKQTKDDGSDKRAQIVTIDESQIRDHLGEVVRGTVEETLNALLQAEAIELCGAPESCYRVNERFVNESSLRLT